MTYTTRHHEQAAGVVGVVGHVPLVELVSPAADTRAGQGSPVARVRSRVKKLIADFLRWYTIRKTIAVLSGLDDHTLADIGIHRSQIREAARRAVGQSVSQ